MTKKTSYYLMNASCLIGALASAYNGVRWLGLDQSLVGIVNLLTAGAFVLIVWGNVRLRREYEEWKRYADELEARIEEYMVP